MYTPLIFNKDKTFRLTYKLYKQNLDDVTRCSKSLKCDSDSEMTANRKLFATELKTRNNKHNNKNNRFDGGTLESVNHVL